MNRFTHIITLVLALVLAGTMPTAAALSPSDVTPAESDETVLTVVEGRERHERSLRDIEAELPLYDAELRHFEGLEGVFTGVKLEEFIAAEGLGDARRVRLIAADEYTVFLTPDEIADRGFLLVTRFEGEPLPPDNLGPLLLVVPDEEEAVLSGETTPTDWAWSIVEIRVR